MRGKAATIGRDARRRDGTQAFGHAHPVSVQGAQLRAEAALADGYGVSLACDPSLEGTLGATGIGYLAHADASRIRLVPRDGCQPRFGEQIVDTPSEASEDLFLLAQRVYRGIEKHVVQGCPRSHAGACPPSCSSACARRLVFAAASDVPIMPDAIHRYARLAFDEGPRLRALVSEERVAEVDEMARAVLGECEHTKQSARFSLLADGSLFTIFRPKADTIPLTAGYFAKRMRNERFCIVDPVHRSAAFYDSGNLGGRRGYAVVRLDHQSADELLPRKDLSPDEPYVHELWHRFYDAVSLPARDGARRGSEQGERWALRRFWGTLGAPEAGSAGVNKAQGAYEAGLK